MKFLLSIALTLLLNFSAEAGSRFFNATFNSKTLGLFKTSIKVSELPLAHEARPEVLANVIRDNGQIVSMNCITTASFKGVANISFQVLDSKKPISTSTSFINVTASDSYEMNDSEEVCKQVPLSDIKKAALAYNLESTVEVKLNNENYFLRISARPFASAVDVKLSGDEKLLSLDWVDLFTTNEYTKSELYYSVYKKSDSSISYYEHGSAKLNLQ